MKTQIITFQDGATLTVKAVPLGKYPELLASLDILPQKLNELDGLSNDEVLVKLPKLLASALPEVTNILKIATDLTDDEVNSLAMVDVVDLITAIWQVNDYSEIFAKVKKAMTRQAPRPSTNLPSSGDGGR